MFIPNFCLQVFGWKITEATTRIPSLHQKNCCQRSENIMYICTCIICIHVISDNIILYHIMSCYIMLCLIMSCYIKLSHIIYTCQSSQWLPWYFSLVILLIPRRLGEPPTPSEMPRCSMKGDGIISLEKTTWQNHQSTIGCNFAECKWECSSTQKCESFLVVIVDVHLNLPIISSQNIPCSLLFRAWSMDFPSPSRRPPCGQPWAGTAMRNLRQMPMI